MRVRAICAALVCALPLLGACSVLPTPVEPAPTIQADVGMPNPASVFCEENGGTLELRTAVDGGQVGACVFSDGSECEEWAFFRGECTAGAAKGSTLEVDVADVPLPDAAALQAFDYAEWQTYKNATYGFSVRFPAGWRVEEASDPGDTMYQHRITLSDPADPMVALHIAFKGASEDRQIGPTGIGAGELVARGSVPFLGVDLGRQVLVAEEKDMQVLYGGTGEFTSGDLVFWIGLNFAGSPLTDPGLSAEVEALADQIVTSVQVAP